MKHRTSLNRLTPTDITVWAREGDTFEAASMSGEVGAWSEGRLDEAWAALYREHRPKITYTVLSYSTPIAWLTPKGWVVPDQGFSISTSRHQGIVRGLRPQLDVWCPGGGGIADPLGEGEKKPWWIRIRAGRCHECKRVVAAPNWRTERHLALKVKASA